MNIQELYRAAFHAPTNPMWRAGRLMGRHCVARKIRGQCKRIKAGKRPFNP